jgi:translocator protein
MNRVAAAALAAGAWALAVAGLGMAVTDLGPWYAALQQPSWKPPDLWFGPAWTLSAPLSPNAPISARRPDWALAEVVLLWLSIVLLIVVAARSSVAAAWLLAPYLLWVAFAGVLNLAVVRLN